MRKVYLEIRKTEDKKFWGLLGDDNQEEARYITAHGNYRDVVKEAQIVAQQIGWDMYEAREVDSNPTQPKGRRDES